MYFVSRQNYYYNGNLTVEITSGGMDYAGADMLADGAEYRQLGSSQEYVDPREAVEAAFRVALYWQKALRKLKRAGAPVRPVCVAFGSTGGMGLEMEPMTWKNIRAAAEASYEKMAKCDQCGEVLPKKHYVDEYRENSFCSETCSNNWTEACCVEEVEEQ
jgi:hypothetical protein